MRAVFEKNIPFALDVAKSAADPANPVSHLGNTPENFVVSSFETSYGDPQDVQVNAKRELGKITMHYRVNGGAEQTAHDQGLERRRALRRRLQPLLPPPPRNG